MSKFLKLGLAALGGTVANKYFNPSQATTARVGTGTPVITGFTTTGGGIGSNLVGSVMNKIGIKPFGATKLGQNVPGFIQTGLSNLMSGKGLLGTDMGFDDPRDEYDMFHGFGKGLPDIGSIQARGVRSDTNFGVSSLGAQIPLGRSGRTQRALEKMQVQDVIAQAVRSPTVPARVLGRTVSPGTLASGRVRVKRSATRTKAYTSDKAQTFS